MKLRLLFAFILITTALAAAAQTSATWGRNTGYAFWNHEQKDLRLINESDSMLVVKAALPEPARHFVITANTCNLRPHPGKKYKGAKKGDSTPPYGIRLTSRQADTLEVFTAVRSVDNMTGREDEQWLTVRRVGRNGVSNIEEFVIGTPLRHDILRIDLYQGGITIEMGEKKLKKVFSLADFAMTADTLAYVLSPGAAIEVVRGTILCHTGAMESAYDLSESQLLTLTEQVNRSEDPLEGIWVYDSRDMDEDHLRMGGFYRLLIVREGDDYLIYYLSGAEKSPSLWRPGLLKGRMLHEGADTYRVEWRDALGRWMLRNIRAASEDTNMLTLLFPSRHSSMYFRREH